MTSATISLLDAALDWVRNGFKVVPLWWPVATGAQPCCACGDPACRDIGKHPIWRLTPHGSKDATSDEATIREWWRRYPEANGLPISRAAPIDRLTDRARIRF